MLNDGVVGDPHYTLIATPGGTSAIRIRSGAGGYPVAPGGPYIGDVEAGGVASLTTPQISVVSGGVLCVVGLAGAALAFPAVWRYRASRHKARGVRPEEAAAAQRG